eukprot:gene9251-10228_t
MSQLKGGSEMFAGIDQQILSSSKQVLLQNIEFQEAKHTDTEAQKIFSKYKPINAAYNSKHLASNPLSILGSSKKVQKQKSIEKDEQLPVPRIVLYPPEKVEMKWKQTRGIGPGFSNLGNTCFLNSVLQVLTYTPPLVNFVDSEAHRNKCVSVGFCLLCELSNHLTRVAKQSPRSGPIRPMTIIQKLSYISKNFKFGRQEDAHEFLRYFIEALRKSCLAGKTSLDRLSKETTAINQIFGGFFRSQVMCLSCKKTSSTYDPMMELNLDIKDANSVMSALKRTIRTEKLDGENKYSCERCRRKMPALKKGNIHKAPKILTLQLKRFDFQRLYGGKVPKHVQFSETLDLGPFMSHESDTPAYYKLYAVLVHSGISCNSGHYYCYVKAPNGVWYEMNDSRVSQVGVATVLRAQAYLLFYSIVQKSPATPSSQQRIADQKLKQSPSPSVSKQTPNKLGARDVGISIMRRDEPRIVSLQKDREKIKFSFQGGDKAKPVTPVKKPHPTTPSKTTGGTTKVYEKSPSLQAIMKDYDSSGSSDESQSRLDKEAKTKATVEEGKNVKEIVKEETNQGESKESLPSNEEPSSTNKEEVKDSFLSPPKSVNLELLHQKRKLKNNASTLQSPSKFGRWFPVKNLNHTFTPRAIYCRSMSDSAAFAKAKKTPTQPTASPQPSAAAVKSEDGSKSNQHWVIEEKKIPEVVFGPMTPPPLKLAQARERTPSISSENGHMPSSTGEWDVYDKDLPGTPLPPYIPERQFAGWSVKKNKPTTFRSNSTGHDSWTMSHEKQDSSHRKDKHSSSAKKCTKIKDGKVYQRLEFENEESSKSHKKHKKRRRDSEAKRCDEDDYTEEDLSPRKKKKKDKCEEKKERKEQRKKKKDKKQKKKSNARHDDSDDDKDGLSSRHADRKSRGSSFKHSSPDRKVDVSDDEGKKKKTKKSKKQRRSPSPIRKKEHKSKKSEEDVDEEKTTTKCTPRRVPLTFLGPLTKSSNRKLEESSGSCRDATDEDKSVKAKKRKKKDKKKKSELFDDDDDEKPALSNGSAKKDAPLKHWDEAPKKMTSWNGSNDNSVLDALLSKKSQVETWNGESSSNMNSNLVAGVSDGSKRCREEWDDYYDEGKTKKIKKNHGNRPSSNKSKHNAFQFMQNKKNQNKFWTCNVTLGKAPSFGLMGIKRS